MSWKHIETYIIQFVHLFARNREDVKAARTALKEEDFSRPLPFEKRYELQQVALELPLLPTTTIGSFPQTTEVRQTRKEWRNGVISNEQYEQFIEKETEKWIRYQEEIGLDVLVHGEFERTDMVEYFGERLAGFSFTKTVGYNLTVPARKTTCYLW